MVSRPRSLPLLEPSREGVSTPRPKVRLLAQPTLDLPKSLGLNRHPVLSAPHLTADQARCLEHPDVARNASEGHGQRPGQVCDAGVAISQRHEERSAGGVSQCAKGPVEDLIFNQLRVPVEIAVWRGDGCGPSQASAAKWSIRPVVGSEGSGDGQACSRVRLLRGEEMSC